MKRPTAIALRALAAAAALAAASLTITSAAATPASATAAGPPATARPDTGRIAFFDGVTGQIYTANPDGTALAQLTREPKGIWARWPAWSPGGSRILFVRVKVSSFMGRIWIMNADGTGQRQFASDTPRHSDYEPGYTPDGRHIVFTRCLPVFEHCAIWIMRSDGTRRHLLIPFLKTPTETSNFNPEVSPDGRHITFTRFGFHGIISQVWVARINGTHAHPLTAPRLEAGQPTWSPDGSHIAFASNTDRAQSSIYVMRADGTDVRRLVMTKWPTDNFAPAYAPNGHQIAFSSDRRYPDLCCQDLFVARANGSQQHLVGTGLHGVVDLAWGSAPPVRAGSSGTLSRLPAGGQVPSASRHVRCGEAPAWPADRQCRAPGAGIVRW